MSESWQLSCQDNSVRDVTTVLRPPLLPYPKEKEAKDDMRLRQYKHSNQTSFSPKPQVSPSRSSFSRSSPISLSASLSSHSSRSSRSSGSPLALLSNSARGGNKKQVLRSRSTRKSIVMASGGVADGSKVGFIGLGIMGKAMAINLQKAGYKVVVWNRTSSKCDELVKLGATGNTSF